MTTSMVSNKQLPTFAKIVNALDEKAIQTFINDGKVIFPKKEKPWDVLPLPHIDHIDDYVDARNPEWWLSFPDKGVLSTLKEDLDADVARLNINKHSNAYKQLLKKNIEVINEVKGIYKEIMNYVRLKNKNEKPNAVISSLLAGAFLGMVGDLFQRIDDNETASMRSLVKPKEVRALFTSHFYFLATQLGFIDQVKSKKLISPMFNIKEAMDNFPAMGGETPKGAF